MKSFFLFLWLIGSAMLLHAQKPMVSDSTFEYYKLLNDSETRLPEFKDSDLNLRLKIMQVILINQSRKKHKANPVQLDILASRVANKMCAEATELAFVGHWNSSGEKPYHRYAFAGGVDHVAENAYGMWTTDKIGDDSASVFKNMKDGHNSFMREIYPNDGHKKNCIDKHHNFVGLGFYTNDHRFSYYEEFIDRYYEFENVPTQPLKVREHHILTVVCDSTSELINAFTCKELPLKKMSANKLNNLGSYLDGTNSMVVIDLPTPQIDADNGNKKRYAFDLVFKSKGLYYLQIFHNRRENSKKTEKNIPGSGICIWVE